MAFDPAALESLQNQLGQSNYDLGSLIRANAAAAGTGLGWTAPVQGGLSDYFQQVLQGRFPPAIAAALQQHVMGPYQTAIERNMDTFGPGAGRAYANTQANTAMQNARADAFSQLMSQGLGQAQQYGLTGQQLYQQPLAAAQQGRLGEFQAKKQAKASSGGGGLFGLF